jgi:hypothetical protein
MLGRSGPGAKDESWEADSCTNYGPDHGLRSHLPRRYERPSVWTGRGNRELAISMRHPDEGSYYQRLGLSP